MDIDVRFNECTRYFGEEGIEGFGREGFRVVGRGELSEGGAELPAQFGEDHFNEVVCCSNGITYGYMIMEAAATAVMVHAVCCFGFLCWFWRLWSRRQTDESHTLLTRGKYLAGRISVHSTWKDDDAQYRSKIDCRLAKSSSSSSSSSYSSREDLDDASTSD